MLTHFPAAILYAAFASTVFGITLRAEPKMMIRYGLYCFGLFVGAVIAVSWLMYFIKH